jgi:hypothetical protein
VSCACALNAPLSWTSSLPCPSALCVRRCGVTTKRFAGGSCLKCSSDVCLPVVAALNVSEAKPLRRLDGGFGFDFCADGGWGAKKRCGDGVCSGIVRPSFVLVQAVRLKIEGDARRGLQQMAWLAMGKMKQGSARRGGRAATRQKKLSPPLARVMQ